MFACFAVCACGSDSSHDCLYDTEKVDPQCTASCCSTVSTATSGDPKYCLTTLAQGGHPDKACTFANDQLVCTCQ